MLVFSRRPTQRIRIGRDIIITVVRVDGDKVRVGIEAPRNVDVHREEVFDAIEAAAEPREDKPTDVMAGGMHHFPTI